MKLPCILIVSSTNQKRNFGYHPSEIPSRARTDAIFMKFPRRRSNDAYTELRWLVYRRNIKVNNYQDLFAYTEYTEYTEIRFSLMIAY